MRSPSTRPGRSLGLVFDVRPARLVLPALLARLGPRAVSRVGPPLRLVRVGEPTLPGPGWARLRPLGSGICGSDVAQATLQADWDNPVAAVPSFPHVMGHEVVAEVTEPAADGTGPPPGARVAVDPWLGCETRGLARHLWCHWCGTGAPALCRRHAEPVAAGHGRGMHIGHVAGLPGGFAAAMVAHAARLVCLPAGMAPVDAVLCDPLAVAGHAVDRAGADAAPAGPALVLGAGTIGLGVVAVLRHRHPDLPVVVTCAWPHLAAEARRLGAIPCPPAQAAVVAAVCAQLRHPRVMHPWRGGPWLHGDGAPFVVDTIGSSTTLTTALAALRPRGRIVSLGVHRSHRAQTALVQLKEAELVGSSGYGRPAAGGGVFDEALALLASGRVAAERWITHRLPLERWREGFAVAASPGRHAAIKVALLPPE